MEADGNSDLWGWVKLKERAPVGTPGQRRGFENLQFLVIARQAENDRAARLALLLSSNLVRVIQYTVWAKCLALSGSAGIRDGSLPAARLGGITP